MRKVINRALDQLDLIFTPESAQLDLEQLQPLAETIQQVQDAYVEIIHQALMLLQEDRQQESHDLLQAERDRLASTLNRIGTLIEQAAEMEQPQLKLLIEYLFTRTRLVDELKMFPTFCLDLLERSSIDESIDETINYLESRMTGKHGLYQQTMDSLNQA